MSSLVTISLVDSGLNVDLGQDNAVFNIEASIDDILYHFHGFSVIQFSGTVKFTVQSSVGLLVSKDESQEHICGNIVPLTALERMCQEALTHQSILAFFQVCQYFFPNLSITVYNTTADDMVSIENVAQFPAHTLWPLLVLAEVFGAPVVAAHCRNLLRQRVASGGSSDGFRKLFAFASCPDAVSAFSDDTIAQIASRLETHFLHFGEDSAGTPGARSSVHAVSSAANREVGTQYSKEGVPVKSIQLMTPTPTATLATPQLRGEQLSSMFDDDESPRPALRTISDSGAFSSPLRYRGSDPVHSTTPKYSSFYGSTDNEKSVHSASSESHLQNSSVAWRYPALHAPRDSFSTPKRSSSPPLVVNSRDRVRSVSASRSKSAHRERDRADPLPTSPPLSEELLQKSREVAVLRLMEVRAKEELALARHLNDREMCANRLRVLELRAEAARYSSAKGSGTHQKRSGGTSVGAASAEYNSAVGAGPNSFNVKYPRSRGPDQSTPVQQRTANDKPTKSPEANRNSVRSRSVSSAHRAKFVAAEGSKPSKGSPSVSKQNNPGKDRAAVVNKFGEKELATVSRPHSATRPMSSSRESDLQQIRGGLQSGQLAVDQREAATSPEEARQRARERIAVARRRMKAKEQEQAAAQQAKLDERFAVRNRKIALYKERQRIPESVEFITADSAPYASGTETGTSRGDGRLHETEILDNVLPRRSPPAVVRVNESSSSAAAWSLLAREERRDAELQGITQSSVHPRLYSSDAIAAVGLGLSPSFSLLGRHRYGPERTEGLSEFDLSAGENTSVCSSLSAPSEVAFSPHSPHPQSTDIAVRVLRANDLPECLGGTNAYVTLDWSGGAGSSRNKQSFGIGTTHHVPGTTDPEFDATLKFRSPFSTQAGNRNGDSLSPRALGIDSSLPVIRVLVFSKNASISDELVAVGELSVFEVVRENYLSGRSQAQAAQDVHSLQLVDLQGRGAGTLDVIVEY